LNSRFTLDEFKSIFYMEWGHRVLGRIIGLSFVLPLTYFASKRMLPKRLVWQLGGMALLLGGQGALGWYMVKSGLEEENFTTPGSVPRVSQYRLASHLGLAFLLYSGMFYTGLSVLKDAAYAQGKPWFSTTAQRALPAFKRFQGASKVLAALVFVTAMSGAYVLPLSFLIS
jgi:heme a synthase